MERTSTSLPPNAQDTHAIMKSAIPMHEMNSTFLPRDALYSSSTLMPSVVIS